MNALAGTAGAPCDEQALKRGASGWESAVSARAGACFAR
jgi:hypothetical protein